MITLKSKSMKWLISPVIALNIVALGMLLAVLSVFAHYHIIDPRSGHSSPELASVSMSAPTVVMVDRFGDCGDGNGSGRGCPRSRRRIKE